jgi:nitrogen fixation protein FixH
MPLTAHIVARRRRKGLDGRHVLAGLVAFFSAVFAVNGAMIYSAISTYSGVVSSEPYRKGLHYNDRIAADARQANLQWQDAIALQGEGRVLFRLTDADGSPVRGLDIEAVVGRPTTNRQDVKLILQPLADGSYAGQIAPLPPGIWLVTIEARLTGSPDPVFRTRRRLWITP